MRNTINVLEIIWSDGTKDLPSVAGRPSAGAVTSCYNCTWIVEIVGIGHDQFYLAVEIDAKVSRRGSCLTPPLVNSAAKSSSNTQVNGPDRWLV